MCGGGEVGNEWLCLPVYVETKSWDQVFSSIVLYFVYYDGSLSKHGLIIQLDLLAIESTGLVYLHPSMKIELSPGCWDHTQLPMMLESAVLYPEDHLPGPLMTHFLPIWSICWQCVSVSLCPTVEDTLWWFFSINLEWKYKIKHNKT